MTGRLIGKEEIAEDPLKFHGLTDGIVTLTSKHGDKITMLTIISPHGEWNVAVREVSRTSQKNRLVAEVERAYARRLIDALRTHGRMITHHLAKPNGG